MAKTSAASCHVSRGLAALVLRLALAAVFLPMGFYKVFGGMGYEGYMDAVQKIAAMSQNVVPEAVATIVGYVWPIAELYLGVALLIGFGKNFTKWVGLAVTFSLVAFWYLQDPAGYTWFMNVHTWFLVAAIALMFTCNLGRYSVDSIMTKQEVPAKSRKK